MNEDEFPDPDEEFDLIPTDILKSSKNLNGSTKKTNETEKSNISSQKILKSFPHDDEFPDEDEFDFISTVTSAPTPTQNIEKTKKRTFEELQKDVEELIANCPTTSKECNLNIPIDDIDDDFLENKTKRPCWDRPKDIIAAIRQEAKKKRIKKENNDFITTNNSSKKSSTNESISLKIPPWNFIGLTRLQDSKRVYVRIRQKKSEKIQKINLKSNLLNINFYQLKDEAEKILVEKAVKETSPISEIISECHDDQLWVDKYRPKRYIELLSDETVNRTFLQWIKLWDKIVFGREIKKYKKIQSNVFGMKKFGKNEEIELVDKRGFPINKIALLNGPPGLGKTTLAHVVAKHAGYNVVEINASDDRGPEAFRQALLSSTQMRSLMGSDPKPNCLILDEIDGAPAASIELLLKFVQGKLNKKKKTEEISTKDNEFCKRPVVCICNDAYIPALRSLRQMAFIIHVPKVSVSNLVDRLITITCCEGINTDRSTLCQLAERSGCDIRSCLGALQYMGSDCEKSHNSLSNKDTKKTIFQSWREILQIPIDRLGPLPMKERSETILQIVYGENSERLAQGVFENYPENCHEKMNQIADSLEWFPFFDSITNVINTKQEWTISPYRNYSFVYWHFGFAGVTNPKLSFPHTANDAKQKLTKNLGILSISRKSRGQDFQTITLDISPFLFEILNPKLRSVASNLYSQKEKFELERLIDIMLNLGLTFVQERNQDGAIDYEIDPNLFEIGIFPDCKIRRGLSYAVKQIVAQELETERLRRVSIAIAEKNQSKNLKNNENENLKNKEIITSSNSFRPNHVKEMDTIITPNERRFKDFFSNFKKQVKSKNQETSPETIKPGRKYRSLVAKYGIYFRYRDASGNAVRRKIKLRDIV